MSLADVMGTLPDAKMDLEYALIANITQMVTSANCAKKGTVGMPPRVHARYVLALSLWLQTVLQQDALEVAEISSASVS